MEQGAVITVPSNRVLTGSDLLNFNHKVDPKFDKKLLERTNLKLSTSNGFKISNVLTEEECLFFIEESEKKGYVTIEKEFPTDYRNNLRYLGVNQRLSELLWDRIESLFRIEDLEGVRPYGFDQGGVWIPIGLDNCFTFGKYLPGGRFKPHYDAVFADSPDRRSVYTIQIYLNDKFKGGNTNFYQSENPLLLDKHILEDSVVPQTGTAIIFNHDTLHSGAEVEEGVKYIIRVDMMFLRIDKSAEGLSTQEQHEMQKARELFFQADSLEKDKKDLDSAIQTYVKAQMLLTSYPSIDSITRKIYDLNLSETSPLKKKPIGSLTTIKEVELFYILQLLKPKELGRLMCTSKYFSKIVVKDSLWKRVFIRDFSMESFTLEQLNQRNTKLAILEKAMASPIKSKKQFVKNWYLTYKNIHQFFFSNKIAIIDVGSEWVKYSGTYNRNDEFNMFIQRVGKRQEYQPHYVMSSMDRYTWVVGNNSTESDNYHGVVDGQYVAGEVIREIVKYASPRISSPVLLIVNPICYIPPGTQTRLQNLDAVKKSLKTSQFVLFRNGGLLTLQSHGLKSGIVLMMGYATTVLCAFVNGEQVAAKKLPIIGKNVIERVHENATDGSNCVNKLFEVNRSYRTIKKLKSHWFLFTKVSQDYQKEISSLEYQEHYSISIPEIYFQEKDHLVDHIFKFINELRNTPQFKNNPDDLCKLAITGGFSCIPGMIERIQKDISTEINANNSSPIQIYASDHRLYDQIKGAKIDLSLTESLHFSFQKE